MAALDPVAQVAKIQLKWKVGVDLSCYNILHFKYTGTLNSNSDATSIATAVDAAVAAGFTLSQHPSTSLEEVIVTDLNSPTGGYGTFLASRAGTAGGGQLPANACVLMNGAVQRRYRGGKARVYLPMGTDTDLQDPQTWLPASVVNFRNHWNATFLQILGITWGSGNFTNAVMVSYYSGGSWVDKSGTGKGPYKRIPTPRHPPVADIITAWAVNVSPGSMRRRIRGKRT